MFIRFTGSYVIEQHKLFKRQKIKLKINPDPSKLSPGTTDTHTCTQVINMLWNLQPIPLSTTKQGPRPLRNPRDPRHKLYRRPPSPIPLIINRPPCNIPLNFCLLADAKPPIRKPGRELRTRQVIHNRYANASSQINCLHHSLQSKPNLTSIMKQMEAIHAPTPPQRKPPIKGAIIKGQKSPRAASTCRDQVTSCLFFGRLELG